MGKIKDIIDKYIPFVWWVFLALLAVCACVCCSVQAACGFGKFWAICGAVGSAFSVLIYAVQAYSEWIDKDNY